MQREEADLSITSSIHFPLLKAPSHLSPTLLRKAPAIPAILSTKPLIANTSPSAIREALSPPLHSKHSQELLTPSPLQNEQRFGLTHTLSPPQRDDELGRSQSRTTRPKEPHPGNSPIRLHPHSPHHDPGPNNADYLRQHKEAPLTKSPVQPQTIGDTGTFLARSFPMDGIRCLNPIGDQTNPRSTPSTARSRRGWILKPLRRHYKRQRNCHIPNVFTPPSPPPGAAPLGKDSSLDADSLPQSPRIP